MGNGEVGSPKQRAGGPQLHPLGAWKSVKQAMVNVERVSELPGGVPVCWKIDAHPSDPNMHLVTVYLIDGLPERLEFWYRSMACREAMPGVDFDHFTVTSWSYPVASLPLPVAARC